MMIYIKQAKVARLRSNKMLKPLIIIPSRLGSTRLQEKALKIINGQP